MFLTLDSNRTTSKLKPSDELWKSKYGMYPLFYCSFLLKYRTLLVKLKKIWQ